MIAAVSLPLRRDEALRPYEPSTPSIRGRSRYRNGAWQHDRLADATRRRIDTRAAGPTEARRGTRAPARPRRCGPVRKAAAPLRRADWRLRTKPAALKSREGRGGFQKESDRMRARRGPLGCSAQVTNAKNSRGRLVIPFALHRQDTGPHGACPKSARRASRSWRVSRTRPSRRECSFRERAFLAGARQRSSTVFGDQASTSTGRSCPIRAPRSAAGSSTAGFHQGSSRKTFGAVRFKPGRPPSRDEHDRGPLFWKRCKTAPRSRVGHRASELELQPSAGLDTVEQARHCEPSACDF